jgi:hypothetical protein
MSLSRSSAVRAHAPAVASSVGPGDGLIRDESCLRGADLRAFGGAATLVLFPQDIIAVVVGHQARRKGQVHCGKNFRHRRVAPSPRLARICRADDRAAAAG